MDFMLTSIALIMSTGAAIATLPAPLASPACVACGVIEDAALDRYSRDERNALLAGEVVADTPLDHPGVDDAEEATIGVAGIVREPPARVWATLVDFPSRPQFQPGTKEVRVMRIDGNRVWLAQHLRFFFIDIRYTVIDTLDPIAGRIDVVLDQTAPHDIADTRGSWQLTPLAAAHETLVTYHAWVHPGRHLSTAIQRFLLRRSLPDLVGGLRDEVERRARTP